VDFAYTPEEEAWRGEVKTWLDGHLVGDAARLGQSTRFTPEDWKVRVTWEQELGRGGWVGLSWPRAFGGREATVMEELVFAQEYALADGPVRAGFFGESLLGPTLIAFGTEDQQTRFLPPVLRGEEYWCQGFSEPGAGSDLASVTTRAVRDGDAWRVDGQKVWTSQAQFADWIFVLCRTEKDSQRHRGLSLLLVPMDQPGLDVRPLVEMTGSDHFCEVFFDGARTGADHVVGSPGRGWEVAMGTLGFERGTAFLAQQLRFAKEYELVVDLARAKGANGDPVVRQRLARCYAGLEIMRYSGYRTITRIARHGTPGPESSAGKLQWSTWHQEMGELAADLLGPDVTLRIGEDDRFADLQHSFLFSRADTIYAGSSEVQRNIIGERVLGLPRV
jgi:alkylation response protein AidB-like acyl-CoA dehydrogenase